MIIENRVKLRLVLIKEKALAQINEYKVSYMCVQAWKSMFEFLNFLSA